MPAKITPLTQPKWENSRNVGEKDENLPTRLILLQALGLVLWDPHVLSKEKINAMKCTWDPLTPRRL